MITKDTEFPRSWKHKGENINCIVQPYMCSLYFCGNYDSGSNAFQSSIDWKRLKSFTNKLKKDPNTLNLQIGKIGDYLTEVDLNLINS